MNLNNVRCVDQPDCDGLWIQLLFKPTHFAKPEDCYIGNPDCYMVEQVNVYQAERDWMILISSQYSKSACPKTVLLSQHNPEGKISKWLHVHPITVNDIQKSFCQGFTSLTSESDVEITDEGWMHCGGNIKLNTYFGDENTGKWVEMK